MLNQVVLVGRLAKDFEVNQSNEEKSVATLTLAVPRNFKNHEGVYETDFIDCVVWDSVAVNTYNYVKKGDILGIKGRMQTRTDKDGKVSLEVIGEKVTFLSSKREEEKKRNENEKEGR